jgi:hypothetical protein
MRDFQSIFAVKKKARMHTKRRWEVSNQGVEGVDWGQKLHGIVLTFAELTMLIREVSKDQNQDVVLQTKNQKPKTQINHRKDDGGEPSVDSAQLYFLGTKNKKTKKARRTRTQLSTKICRVFLTVSF